jgi:hypothetical protein
MLERKQRVSATRGTAGARDKELEGPRRAGGAASGILALDGRRAETSEEVAVSLGWALKGLSGEGPQGRTQG